MLLSTLAAATGIIHTFQNPSPHHQDKQNSSAKNHIIVAGHRLYTVPLPKSILFAIGTITYNSSMAANATYENHSLAHRFGFEVAAHNHDSCYDDLTGTKLQNRTDCSPYFLLVGSTARRDKIYLPRGVKAGLVTVFAADAEDEIDAIVQMTGKDKKDENEGTLSSASHDRRHLTMSSTELPNTDMTSESVAAPVNESDDEAEGGDNDVVDSTTTVATTSTQTTSVTTLSSASSKTLTVTSGTRSAATTTTTLKTTPTGSSMTTSTTTRLPSNSPKQDYSCPAMLVYGKEDKMGPGINNIAIRRIKGQVGGKTVYYPNKHGSPQCRKLKHCVVASHDNITSCLDDLKHQIEAKMCANITTTYGAREPIACAPGNGSHYCVWYDYEAFVPKRGKDLAIWNKVNTEPFTEMGFNQVPIQAIYEGLRWMMEIGAKACGHSLLPVPLNPEGEGKIGHAHVLHVDYDQSLHMETSH